MNETIENSMYSIFFAIDSTIACQKKNLYTDDRITDPKIKNLSCVNIAFFSEGYVCIDLIFCLANKTVSLSTPTSATIVGIEIQSL
jgi:hypothetical protein